MGRQAPLRLFRDGIDGIIEALSRRGNEPEFIQVRHEETAVLKACANAAFTGEAGVCLATQEPGAIHLLNSLYDTRLDRPPVVTIVGQVALESSAGAINRKSIWPRSSRMSPRSPM